MEETLDGLLHHRTPGPIVAFLKIGVTLLELVPVVFETLVERAALGMAGSVGARKGHPLPETIPSPKLRGIFSIP